MKKFLVCEWLREMQFLGADLLSLEGGGGDFGKKIAASACRKKKIACSTNVIENILPTRLLEKKILDDQK